MEGRYIFMALGASTSKNQMPLVPPKEKPENVTTRQDSDPTMLKSFLHTCMKLLWDHKVVDALQEIIDKYTCKDSRLQGQCIVNKVNQRNKRTDREMQLTTQINEFEMDQVILDMDFDSNVLLKKNWECMGNPKLQWSPIQLHMANQQKIIPMGHLCGVTVDIEGVRVVVDYEVIEITDDSNPY